MTRLRCALGRVRQGPEAGPPRPPAQDVGGGAAGFIEAAARKGVRMRALCFYRRLCATRILLLQTSVSVAPVFPNDQSTRLPSTAICNLAGHSHYLVHAAPSFVEARPYRCIEPKLQPAFCPPNSMHSRFVRFHPVNYIKPILNFWILIAQSVAPLPIR